MAYSIASSACLNCGTWHRAGIGGGGWWGVGEIVETTPGPNYVVRGQLLDH